ncbi:MAG: YchF/TatD family DNA exonuclease [Ignavibacteriales bacterium]|nr:YchF/TatD family DNA exonuclease [Ignavibacteriales bacterium]
MFIDTHCHLFYPNFNGEVAEIINRAIEAGVDYIIVPSTNLASCRQAIDLANRYECVYAAIGVHPHDTNEWDDSIIDSLEKLSKENKVVAIGEIGLDYYYDFSPREKQINAFEQQIELAILSDLPVIIHNREANEDTMEIVKKYSTKGLRAQFHCYAGTVEEAKELIKLGHYISFTGNITFKNTEDIRKKLIQIGMKNLLLETDAPFMAPEPFRGKRNEPSYLKITAEKIAELFNLTTKEIGRIASFNAYKLFKVGKEPQANFTYELNDNLYINITNRCDSNCIFCNRESNPVISGYNLKMNQEDEPPAHVYINEIGDPKKYKEIVFCGYGEPTIRWDVVKLIATYVKENGGTTRLNTNGHGNIINKKDITPEFEGLIDTVSISLNSSDAIEYARLMNVPSEYHDEMIKFAKSAKKYSHIIMTIVGLDKVDEEAAKNLVTEEIGAEFHVRHYFE